MFIHGGGGSDVFPRLPRAVNIISFDFALLSCKLLLVAQASICVISVRLEVELGIRIATEIASISVSVAKLLLLPVCGTVSASSLYLMVFYIVCRCRRKCKGIGRAQKLCRSR